MIVYDIYDFLHEKYDFSSALPYDNVGLLVGDGRDKVNGILLCLDITDEAITEAANLGANLIITHHPVIFDPLKSVREESTVYRLIKNGMSVISVHTNLDAADGGVNDCLCERAGLKNVEKIADSEGFFYRIGEYEEPISADALAEKLSKALKVNIKYVGENTFIKKLAVCSGSGGSMLGEVMETGADAYLTADVKHDVFMDAHRAGFTVFDAGHFNTEDIVIAPLCKALSQAFSDAKIYENHFSPIKYKNF